MRSNSGRDESRNNMRDPTTRERGRGNSSKGGRPKAPSDHRQGRKD